MRPYQDLKAYKLAFDLAMKIFEVSKRFPREEKFSLTDQIRRSSRSVCANLAEAFARVKYDAHFSSKLTDCDAENAETEVWLNFSYSCKYVVKEEFDALLAQKNEVGRLLGDIIRNPDKYR